MLLSDYSYDLPDKNIAKFPPKIRGTSRLLVLDRKTGKTTDSMYKNLDNFLEPGDLLILNDTRVMRSRLFTRLPDGRPRELVVLEKHDSDTNHIMYRGKLHVGDVLTVENYKDKSLTSDTVTVQEILDGRVSLLSVQVAIFKISFSILAMFHFHHIYTATLHPKILSAIKPSGQSNSVAPQPQPRSLT